MDGFAITETLVGFLRRWGELSPTSAVVLALVFVAGGLVPVPRAFLSLASGVVFGMAAVPIILPSTTLGAVIGFLIARYLFAERLWRAISRRPKAALIMNAVNAEGWRVVALCRLASPIPSTIQNAMFGLTRIGLWPYTWASFVFMAPLTVLYVYLGSVGKAALLEEEGSGVSLGLMAAGGLAFLAIVLIIARRVRASMRDLEQRASANAT